MGSIEAKSDSSYMKHTIKMFTFILSKKFSCPMSHGQTPLGKSIMATTRK